MAPKAQKKTRRKAKTRSEAKWKDLGFGRIALRLPASTLQILDRVARQRRVTRTEVVKQLIEDLAQAEQKRKKRSQRAAEARDRRDRAFDDRISANARHRDVVQACKVLGADPPKQGELLDRGRTRAAYGRYMAKNHPDRGGTAEAVREGIEAWKILTDAFGWQ